MVELINAVLKCLPWGEVSSHTAQDIADHLAENDVVQVVRCKDCKYYRCYGRTSLLIDGKNKKAGWCQRRICRDEEYRMLPDDYCSYGVRKDGAENGN